MPSNHLILCCPLLLLPPIPPSIRVFSSESTIHMRWPKYWSFSFSISPSNEHPGLISFRMDLYYIKLRCSQENIKMIFTLSYIFFLGKWMICEILSLPLTLKYFVICSYIHNFLTIHDTDLSFFPPKSTILLSKTYSLINHSIYLWYVLESSSIFLS